MYEQCKPEKLLMQPRVLADFHFASVVFWVFWLAEKRNKHQQIKQINKPTPSASDSRSDSGHLVVNSGDAMMALESSEHASKWGVYISSWNKKTGGSTHLINIYVSLLQCFLPKRLQIRVPHYAFALYTTHFHCKPLLPSLFRWVI